MVSENSNVSRRDTMIALATGILSTGVTSEAIAANVAADSAALENAVELLRRALVDGDGKVLTQILHDRMTYSHSDGRVWTKHDLLENIEGKQRYLSISLSQQTVDAVGPVGVVRHIYDVVNNLGDGKTSSSHIKVLLCWIKSGKDWQLLARSSTTVAA